MAYAQAHPRLSALSTTSLSSVEHLSSSVNSPRFSVPPGVPISTAGGTPKAGIRPNIYDRSLNKTRTTEVSLSAYAFLFSEIIQYTQKRVNGIGDLERRSVSSFVRKQPNGVAERAFIRTG